MGKKSNAGILSWDDEYNFAVLEWHGVVAGDSFRQPILQGVELLKEKKAIKFLNDGSRQIPVPEEDERWINEVVFPQLVAIGIKYIAVVLPKGDKRKVENKVSVQKMVEAVPFTLEYFDDSAVARKWLENV